MDRVTYKKPQEVERIRAAGKVVSTVLAAMRAAVAPGVSTLDLDRLAFDLIAEHGGTPSFLNHRAGRNVYHHSICASVNGEIVHGIPRADRLLREGEIVSLDVGVKLHGYHADSAITVPVGEVSNEAQKLLEVTHRSLWAGLKAIRPRGHLRDISKAVQTCVEKEGFSLVRELSGHGIGKQLWEPPSIYNWVGSNHPNPPLLEGMALAIEPMVNVGKPDILHLADGWGIITTDGSLSAHFEHTIVVTRNGIEVLTLGPHEPEPQFSLA